jgi:hypothetical protein
MRRAHFFFMGLVLSTALLLPACGADPSNKTDLKPLAFDTLQIADDAQFWWAHQPAFINDDDLADLVYIHDNATGGYLAYREGSQEPGNWKEIIVAETSPDGKLFASGDLECGDIDADGDVDILAVEHVGEWADADAPARIFWYENPTWEAHLIGEVPDAVKDVSLAEFNQDDLLDLAILTFEESTLSFFMQKGKGDWTRTAFLQNFGNLHEGMNTGDINQDGFTDVVANGYVFYNPALGEPADWRPENIDTIWNNQTGDWSRNATKSVVGDLNQDGKPEVIFAHSERSGYPIASYSRTREGTWKKTLIADSITACHTLEIADFDLDGDLDILSGVNKGRAVNLQKSIFEVTIHQNSGRAEGWKTFLISENGIYNGRVIDFDGDGDVDIFRYPSHESEEYFIWRNQVK